MFHPRHERHECRNCRYWACNYIGFGKASWGWCSWREDNHKPDHPPQTGKGYVYADHGVNLETHEKHSCEMWEPDDDPQKA